MYLNYFKQFIDCAVENKNELKKYYFLSVIVGLLELTGVALIYPFIFSIVNNTSELNIKDFILGITVVGLFLAKNIFMIYYSRLQIDFAQKSEFYISYKFMKFFLWGKYHDSYKISYAQKSHILNYIIPNCINNFLFRVLNLSINILIVILILGFLFFKFFTASVITLFCAGIIVFIEIKFFQYKTKNLPIVLKELNLL